MEELLIVAAGHQQQYMHMKEKVVSGSQTIAAGVQA